MKSFVDQTLELMEKTFGKGEKGFKTYYTGDPDVIPLFNLPCIIVTQTRDDTTESQQGEDDITDTIVIKIVLNKADDYTGSIDPLNLTEKRLRDFVGELDDEGAYKPKTVKHALRTALLDGDIEAVAPTMSVEYGLNPRNSLGKASNVEWTTEAWVTFTVQHSVQTYP